MLKHSIPQRKSKSRMQMFSNLLVFHPSLAASSRIRKVRCFSFSESVDVTQHTMIKTSIIIMCWKWHATDNFSYSPYLPQYLPFFLWLQLQLFVHQYLVGIPNQLCSNSVYFLHWKRSCFLGSTWRRRSFVPLSMYLLRFRWHEPLFPETFL